MPSAIKYKNFKSSTSDIREWEYRRIRMILYLESVQVGDAPQYLEDARGLLTRGVSTYDGYVIQRAAYENAWFEYQALRPRHVYDRKYAKRLAVLGYALSLPAKDWKPHAADGPHLRWLDRIESMRKQYASERDLLMLCGSKPASRQSTQAQRDVRAKLARGPRAKPSSDAPSDFLDPSFQERVAAAVAETEFRNAVNHAQVKPVEDSF